jgi:hypothetical protein
MGEMQIDPISVPEPHESPSLKVRRYWPIASLWGLARPCEVFMHPVPKPDRRSPSRPLDPSTCPECHALATPALFRTDTAVYYHCARCAYLWSIQKPVQAISNIPVFHRFDWGSFPNE